MTVKSALCVLYMSHRIDDPVSAIVIDAVLKAAAMVAPVPFRAVEFINDAMFRG